jgi:hypothetical protein
MEEKDTNRWGTVLFNGTATLGFGKDLKAQNRLKALEFAVMHMNLPQELYGKMSFLDYCKQEAEKILDWAYEEEEKEVKPDECECFPCQDLIDRIEKAYIEMQEKELEKEFRELIKKYTDLIK